MPSVAPASAALGTCNTRQHRAAPCDVRAEAYANHPALLRLRELETLSELARNANARLYVGFDKHATPEVAAAG